MVAAAVGIGSAVAGVYGASKQASAATSAANTQAGASAAAQQAQQANLDRTRSDLSPFLAAGQSAVNPLIAAMGYNPDWSVNGNNTLQQQFSAPTAQQAQQTPGYQFTLDQGLKSTQNSAAARGLGSSGAALKGAATYATGLADSTYNDVYNRALNTFKTNYGVASDNVNRLQGVVSNGQNAANFAGSVGAATASGIANSITGAGNALAAGTIGSANASSAGANSLASGLGSYALLNNAASAKTTDTRQGIASSGWTNGYGDTFQQNGYSANQSYG